MSGVITAVAVALEVSWAMAAFIVASVVIMAASIGYSAYMMASMPDMPGYSSEVRGRSQIVRSAVTPHRIIYGTCMVSGPLAYALSAGENNKYLYMVILLASHEVEAITDIYLGDKLWTDDRYTSVLKVTKYLGTLDQEADPELIQQSNGQWTSAHRLTGRAYIVVRLTYDTDKFPTGIPNIKAVVKGKNNIYDPRTSTYGYTDNWALCIMDYLMSPQGLNCALKTAEYIDYGGTTWTDSFGNPWVAVLSSEINMPLAISAANICDQSVTVKCGTGTGYTTDTAGYDTGRRIITLISGTGTILAGDVIHITFDGSTDTYDVERGLSDGLLMLAGDGVTRAIPKSACSVVVVQTKSEKRYTCNGAFELSQKPVDIMKKLLTGAAGQVIWSQGAYNIYPAYYTAPVMSLTASDLRNNIEVQTSLSIKDKYNSVRGTFVSPANGWQQTDFPGQINSIAIGNDGQELVQSIELPYTITSSMAQRIAKIHLEQGLQGITVNFPAKMTAFALQPMDCVTLTIDALGWADKEFKVTSWTLSDQGGVDLVLREEASAIYDWNDGMETVIDPAPNTTLPDPWTVPAPADFVAVESLYATNTASAIKCQVLLTWSATASGIQQYELEQRDSYSAWTPCGTSPGGSLTVYDIAPGLWYFRVRAVSSLGVRGSWATISPYIYGKTAAPSAPGSLSAYILDRWIKISWTATPDLDLSSYEIRMGGSGSTWDTAETIANPSAPTTSYLWAPNHTGVMRFFIKALDTSGNWSEVRQSVSDLTIAAPQFPSGATVNPQVIDNNVLLKWPDAVIGSYPVAFYRLRRGVTPFDFASATVIGDKLGTFTVVFETAAATYKYWISPVDSAGIEGDAIGVYASVNQPPDYILQYDLDLAPAWSGTKTNAAIDYNGALVLPVNSAETYQGHFTSHGWGQPSDQVAAGYPVYIQPGMSSGSYQETIDYGTVIASTRVTFDVTRTTASGTVTVTPTISVSPDNVTWTDHTGVYQVYATNFRYVKYRLDVATSDSGVLFFLSARAKLEAKQKTYEGTVACSSGDSGGTSVNITGQFIDVNSIQVTAAGSSPIIAIYDFVDAPYPTTFKVLLYNTSGSRVSGTASFLLRGV